MRNKEVMMNSTEITSLGYYAGEATTDNGQEHDNTSYWITRLKQRLEQLGKDNIKFFFSNKGINFNVLDLNQMKDNEIYMYICHNPQNNENNIFYTNRASAVKYIRDSKNIEDLGEEPYNNTFPVNPGTMFNKTNDENDNKKYVSKIRISGYGAMKGLHSKLMTFINDPVDDGNLTKLLAEFENLLNKLASES